MRPKFHLSAPKGLINDPNGFIKYQGEYYLFFQWNPSGLKHENKHWGLRKTQDFIHFTQAQIALAPDQRYDKDGCYSGSSRIVHDDLYLFYTGNIKAENTRHSTQCLALKKQDHYEKLGPIIDSIPQGYTGHFRDPYYFQYKQHHYFIIGAQTTDLKGTALIYNWDDLEKPKLLGPLETNFPFAAYMWECPNLFQLEEKEIMIFSPQGIANEKTRYQNLYHAIYSVGDLDLETLSYHSETYEELDYGFDFYAPQVLADENLLIGWMGLPEDEEKHLSIKENWLHTLTMVRVLSLENRRLKQSPHPNYLKMRQKKQVLAKTAQVSSTLGEINLKIKLEAESEFTLALFASKHYETTLSYQEGLLTLDRDKSQGLKGQRHAVLENEDTLTLQIFMDESTVEIFINNGEKVMSARVYNEEDQAGFYIKTMTNCALETYCYYDYEV